VKAPYEFPNFEIDNNYTIQIAWSYNPKYTYRKRW